MKVFNRKNLLLVLIVFVITKPLVSQVNDNSEITAGKAELILIARADKDSVVLRWAPSTPGGWVVANRIGYNIERVKLNPDNPFNPDDFERLNSVPVKPLSLEQWKQTVSEENIFSAIASQAIYGKLFIPKALDENNLNALKNSADELMNRYTFALFAADNDAATASAMGLRWVDKNLQEGLSYVYRVYVAEVTNEYSFDTAFVVVDVKAAEKIPSPSDLTFESGDGSIRLKWKENPYEKFSGFYIYRSDDGINYKKLNEMPLVIATPFGATEEAEPSFTDTMTINYKNYYYRVYGITSFGELSEPAEIKAYSKDLTAPQAPVLDKPKQFNNDEVSLTWKLNESSSDLAGFVIARSNNPLYNFEILTSKPLPKNVFSFADKISQQEEVYYSVGAVDTAGNVAFSLPQMVILIDTMPPSVPKGLTGAIDVNGVVTLKWNSGPEWNLFGYRILRANDPNHEFQQLTGEVWTDTTFTDTVNIKTLTRYVYYRIAAVNTRYQHSELSPVLALKRPDIVPPVAAEFNNVYVTDSSVVLEWITSPSKDVAHQRLLKRKQGESSWQQIDSLSGIISSYVDKNVEKTLTYDYTIVTVDSSGLESAPSFLVSGRPYDTGRRVPVNNLTARYDDKNSSVVLSWDYKNPPKEKYWFVIYRGYEPDNTFELKSVDSNTFNYSDKEISRNTKYYYAVAVMTSFGGQSEKVVVEVNIPER